MLCYNQRMNPEKITESVGFPDIKKEITAMTKVDQDMRESDEWGDSVDRNHTQRMKEVVEEIGWPTVSKVGAQAAEEAWLLVQHADLDVAFQKHCLELMKAEPESEVSVINIAYLTDRICVNSGLGQVYGTQFRQIDGAHVPCPIEDAGAIDQRRAEIGIGPLSEQTQIMYDKYGTPVITKSEADNEKG